MLITERKSRLSELLAKLAEFCPSRITKAVFGEGWDLQVNGVALSLRKDAGNPVDEAFIISACFQEARQRGWRFGCSVAGTEYGSVYFARCEMSNDSEVTSESDSHAVAALEALIKAIELSQAMDEDFAEWG